MENAEICDRATQSQIVHPDRPQILIVEDDVTMQPLWTYVIDAVAPRANVKWVMTEEAAEKAISRRIQFSDEFDLVISDIFLSGSRTGVDLWRRYGSGSSRFLFMSVVSPAKFETLVGAGENAPFFLQKPIRPDVCMETVEAILKL